jgi:hypothetical protein
MGDANLVGDLVLACVMTQLAINLGFPFELLVELQVGYRSFRHVDFLREFSLSLNGTSARFRYSMICSVVKVFKNVFVGKG